MDAFHIIFEAIRAEVPPTSSQKKQPVRGETRSSLSGRHASLRRVACRRAAWAASTGEHRADTQKPKGTHYRWRLQTRVRLAARLRVHRVAV